MHESEGSGVSVVGGWFHLIHCLLSFLIFVVLYTTLVNLCQLLHTDLRFVLSFFLSDQIYRLDQKV